VTLIERRLIVAEDETVREVAEAEAAGERREAES
jgi:hypothetical protein